jgi:ARC6-like, IMS domain
MSQLESLITRIDRQLRSIHQERALVAQAGKTTVGQEPLLSEYLQLATTDGIIPAIKHITLDGLARHFNLYEDERERQQILAGVGDELSQSNHGEILASIEIIQCTCPLIAKICQEQMTLTKERAIRQRTGINITSQPTTLPFIERTPDRLKEIDPKSNLSSGKKYPNRLMTGIGMVAVSTVFGGLLATSLNKPPLNTNQNNAPISSSPSLSPVDKSHTVINSPSSSLPNPNVNPIAKQDPIPVANVSNISRDAAIDIVKQWLDYKRILFAVPYNTAQASELLTGKAYKNKIDRSGEPCNSQDEEGCLSSVDWLKKYESEYSFGVQRIDSIDRFEASNDTASIFVTVTGSKSSGGTIKSRYDLTYEDGKVKINDYKTFDGSTKEDINIDISSNNSKILSKNTATITDQQSSSSATYPSHCTFLSALNKQQNIIDDNCSVSVNSDNSYTLTWSNGEVHTINFDNKNKVVINGSDAEIVQKNSDGITISYARGKIGWDLK